MSMWTKNTLVFPVCCDKLCPHTRAFLSPRHFLKGEIMAAASRAVDDAASRVDDMIDMLFGTADDPRSYTTAVEYYATANDDDEEDSDEGENSILLEMEAIAGAITDIPDDERRRECNGKLLYTAMIRGYPTNIISIITRDHPPSFDYIDSDGKTVLHLVHVVEGGMEQLVSLSSVRAISPVHEHIGSTKPYCNLGILDFLRCAHRFHMDVDGVDSLGLTPLAFHACQGSRLTIKLLLAAGADPNKVMVVDGRKTTALLLATQGKRIFTTCLGMLVKYGADINWADEDGNTPRSSILEAVAEDDREKAAACLGVTYIPCRKVKPARE